MGSRHVSFVVVCCVALASASCGARFDPYWRVEDFRVLGVKSEPPTLQAGERATLSALAYAPDGDDVEYQWSWCPFQTSPSSGYACPVSREELVELLAERAPAGVDVDALVPSYDLGSGQQAELPYPTDPRLVRALCEATEGLLADENDVLGGEVGVSACDRGMTVTVRLVARSGDDEVIAGKEVVLSTGDERFANANPRVDAVQIRLMDERKGAMYADELPWTMRVSPDGWYTMPEDAVTPIKTNVEFEVRSLVDPERVESFRAPAPAGALTEDGFGEPEREVVIYRWFVSEGFIGDTRRIHAEGVSPQGLADTSISPYRVLYEPDMPLEPAQEGDWDLDGVSNEDDPCPWVTRERSAACEAKIWSVVRDGRGGLDWTARRVRVLGP